MKEVVKEFIEDTIFLVEDENYYEMFSIWYNHYVDTSSSFEDAVNLDDLFKTFSAAGINLYKESEEARKQVLWEYMYEYMEDRLFTTKDKEITLTDAMSRLKSKLYVSAIDINKIFKDVAETLASAFDDLTVLPFKIVRKI